MSTTPHAAAAGAARQRLAASLGALQQDPNVPPAILEIISGLARAMGPLFQLERGSPDLTLFVQARGVLQETLGRMQTADQSYPGVADATSAIAQSLGMIFQTMREAGLVPASPSQPPPAAAPPTPTQPAAQPAVMQPAVTQPAVMQPAAQPAAMQPAATASALAATFAQPVSPQPPVAAPAQPPIAAPAQAPAAAPKQAAPVAAGPPARPPSGQYKAPGGAPHAPSPAAPSASVPTGPNGVPRLEAEIGVHSETNFYTDFLGDIRNHGGIFVATVHVLPIGSPCEVLLTFPGNLTAEIRGVAKWKRENSPGMAASPGLGIEITQANAESWNLIDRFMRKREPIMHEM